MAEAIVLVCDECEQLAEETVTITMLSSKAKKVKDLCSKHLTAFLKNTRNPKRGRPRATA